MSVVRYDHIVIGAGALGAAAAYWLSAAGRGRTLVCEQFAAGHPWGSSDDHSRIIRHAYHSPIYTALTPSAYRLWGEVEARAGERLLIRSGGLDLAREGSAGHDVMRLYGRSMDAAGLPYEEFGAAELRRRWPDWHVPDDTVALYQAEGGLIDIRAATAAHLRLATRQGAQVLEECLVHDVESGDDGVVVHTSRGTFAAGALVMCAGSWAGGLLDRLGSPFPLELTQEQVQYFTVDDAARFTPDRFPIWIWHADHEIYGIPVYGERAVKVARDMTGKFVTPETRGHIPDPAETEFVRAFVREILPAWAGELALAKTCVYDLPRDRELVIGALPGNPRVFVAVGAGHAGKFATLIGRALADLVTEGGTPYAVEPFSPGRPGLAADAPALYRLGIRELT
ncbi:N-methyl-L-tryptophan oxidase [Nonomuraea sediminis]|uniref:N-methyl-L-tryptophan oxidase n=1 Tax=Nonomuraea sediminis TaxID=2835864 RepID=UPI001BDC1629|nr:N-methyl-L-tryptophan oxidase [Nonomuraea sediminis]